MVVCGQTQDPAVDTKLGCWSYHRSASAADGCCDAHVAAAARAHEPQLAWLPCLASRLEVLSAGAAAALAAGLGLGVGLGRAAAREHQGRT